MKVLDRAPGKRHTDGTDRTDLHCFAGNDKNPGGLLLSFSAGERIHGQGIMEFGQCVGHVWTFMPGATGLCGCLDTTGHFLFLTQRKRDRHRERRDYVFDNQHAVVLCVALCVLCVKNVQ